MISGTVTFKIDDDVFEAEAADRGARRRRRYRSIHNDTAAEAQVPDLLPASPIRRSRRPTTSGDGSPAADRPLQRGVERARPRHDHVAARPTWCSRTTRRETAQGEEVRAHIARIFESWPDIHFTTRRLYVREDLVTQEWTATTATHVKTMRRGDVTAEPTNKRIEVARDGRDPVRERPDQAQGRLLGLRLDPPPRSACSRRARQACPGVAFVSSARCASAIASKSKTRRPASRGIGTALGARHDVLQRHVGEREVVVAEDERARERAQLDAGREVGERVEVRHRIEPAEEAGQADAALRPHAGERVAQRRVADEVEHGVDRLDAAGERAVVDQHAIGAELAQRARAPRCVWWRTRSRRRPRRR